MTKLHHTHESGGDCLACIFGGIRLAFEFGDVRTMMANEGHRWREDFDRIEAALAEREHLEEGAALLRDGQRIGSPNEFATRWQSWLEAERARKGEKG